MIRAAIPPVIAALAVLGAPAPATAGGLLTVHGGYGTMGTVFPRSTPEPENLDGVLAQFGSVSWTSSTTAAWRGPQNRGGEASVGAWDSRRYSPQVSVRCSNPAGATVITRPIVTFHSENGEWHVSTICDGLFHTSPRIIWNIIADPQKADARPWLSVDWKGLKIAPVVELVR